MSKLYPPTIASSVPAFYCDTNGVGTISVPFSMNRAVSLNEVNGYALKIKTAQTNTLLTIITDGALQSNNCVNFNVAVNVGTTTDTTKLNLKAPQYLKIQMAYISTDETIGYYSTPAIVKFTTEPTATIEGLQQGASTTSGIYDFTNVYKGVYTLGDDKTERPYLYNFSLFNRLNPTEIYETSGWLLHNSTLDELDTLDQTVDFYTFKLSLDNLIGGSYGLQYKVKTINDLEVKSEIYNVASFGVDPPILTGSLSAVNIFEEGYVALFLVPDSQDGAFSSSVTIEIQRAEYKDGYTTWYTMKQAYFEQNAPIQTYEFRDMTIEQGVKYKYCYREYGVDGSYSSRIYSNVVQADFEDMFLSDGTKQLKIRFNPKIASFKTTRLEQKIDTLGSRYPFIFRNGIVNYKEFPIGGLISYRMDENALFMSYEDDLNILSNPNAVRLSSPATNNDWELIETLDSWGYNSMAERKFKNAVLDWLENGKVKLFRSTTEGNFLVRLMNVSLTPEDRLGRMLHSFTATAYEMYELTYDNLLKQGFIDVNDLTEYVLSTKAVKISDVINAQSSVSDTTSINLTPGESIWQMLIIQPANNAATGNGSLAFYLRVGADNESNKTLITASTPLVLQGGESFFVGGLYINANDNISWRTAADTDTKSWLKSLVADTVITYGYQTVRRLTGSYTSDITTREEVNVETLYRPIASKISFETITSTSGSIKTTREITEIINLEFQKKTIIEVVFINGLYYEKTSLNEISTFLQTSLYLLGSAYYYGNGTNGLTSSSQLSSSEVNDMYQIQITNADNTVETYSEIPNINFSDLSPADLKTISFGAGIIATNYSYKQTITTEAV